MQVKTTRTEIPVQDLCSPRLQADGHKRWFPFVTFEMLLHWERTGM
jgi:hypothetical protein